MQAPDETSAFTAVTRHLQQQFPRLPEVRISAVVEGQKQRFARARIREFVPPLTERAAASRLRREAVLPAPPQE